MNFMLEFLFPALLGGSAIALLAGPLGSFIVWRKMAYFGDTLSHASLLGIALGLFFQINLTVAIILCCLLLAIILVGLEKNQTVSTDTLLGILAHSALSLGLVAISFFDHIRVDLMAYLFGDLLSITFKDAGLLWLGALIISGLLIGLWRALLAITLNEELAKVDGLPVEKLRLTLMLLIGIVIAVAMQFVGALIITSLLIIPAATARKISTSPEQMAIFASLIGIVSIGGGLIGSAYYDTPAGPSVVVIAAFLFFESLCVTFCYTIPKQRQAVKEEAGSHGF
jgi:zinc transport system permease protein